VTRTVEGYDEQAAPFGPAFPREPRIGDSIHRSRAVPGPCPVCGAVSLAPETQTSTLLAVCDVLVLKALEAMGKYIVRAERSRHRTLDSRPYHVAHTVWQPTDAVVDKALKNAWDVVPALLDVHGCCDVTALQVTRMLDAYVHDLVITGTPHSIAELLYRFDTRLGLPVYAREHPDPLLSSGINGKNAGPIGLGRPSSRDAE
jgi:hypothetical protein